MRALGAFDTPGSAGWSAGTRTAFKVLIPPLGRDALGRVRQGGWMSGTTSIALGIRGQLPAKRKQ